MKKKLIALALVLGIGATFLLLYKEKNKPYHAVLPVKFNNSNCPYINLRIGEINYPLVMELRSDLHILMNAAPLENIDKEPFSVEKWEGQGKDFEHKTFIIPKVELGSVVLENSIAAQKTPEEEAKGPIWKDPNIDLPPPEEVGCIGRNFLKKVNLLLDMSNSKVIATNSVKKLKEDGYDISTFLKVPFVFTTKGILLQIETNIGRLTLALDTGSTVIFLHHFLHPKNVEKQLSRHGFPTLTTTSFKIQNTDFGNQKLYFAKMSEELQDLDGFLGMDFIKNQVIYIDFVKKQLYIQKPSPTTTSS